VVGTGVGAGVIGTGVGAGVIGTGVGAGVGLGSPPPPPPQESTLHVKVPGQFQFCIASLKRAPFVEVYKVD